MKKSLIALAALAAIGSASAEVSVYAKADLGLQSVTTTGETNQGLQVVGGGYEGMRFGLKGSTDLGGGMKGSFQLEKSIKNASGDFQTFEGAQTGFDRVASASVSGAFGTVSAGRQWTPFDNAFWTGDSMEYNGFSASNKVLNSGYHSDNGNTGWGNAKNSIQYASPDMSGFQAFVLYAPNADATASSSATSYTGFGLNYGKGPLTVNFATERVLNTVNGLVGAGYTNAWIVTGAYDLGMASVYGAYETADAENIGKDVGYGLGVKVPMGKAYATFGYASEKATAAVTSSEAKASGWGAQYIYNWNKDTVVYAGYRSVTKTPAGGADSTTTTLGTGIRYNY